jgi:hypothetical protein
MRPPHLMPCEELLKSLHNSPRSLRGSCSKGSRGWLRWAAFTWCSHPSFLDLPADLPEKVLNPVSEVKETPMSAHLRLVEPRNEIRSVPTRPAYAELRQREYLTKAEVDKLKKAATDGRYGHRDATLILIAFRHGLRAQEICDLEWSQVELGRSASLHVRRVKNGKPSVHPLRGDEIRALRELRRQFPDSAFVFATERCGPFTPDAVNRLIKRIGERAGFEFHVHAHMLRHGCGYALANAGHDTRAIQDWLGHLTVLTGPPDSCGPGRRTDPPGRTRTEKKPKPPADPGTAEGARSRLRALPGHAARKSRDTVLRHEVVILVRRNVPTRLASPDMAA